MVRGLALPFVRLVFGEHDGRPIARGAAFHAACQAAGFDSVNTNEILVAFGKNSC